MGSVTFNFLRSSLLFDVNRIDEHYAGLSEGRLRQELTRYREHVIANLKELKYEIADKPGQLRLLGADHFHSVSQLTQAAFYLDQVVLKDPLFPYSEEHTQAKRHMNLAIGVPDPDVINREGVAKAALLMRQLTPMVAANYVTFFPTSLFEERSEVPLVVPGDDLFASLLPDKIHEIYRRYGKVRNVIQGDGCLLVASKPLERGRFISINFDQDACGYVYRLAQHETRILDEEKRLVQFVIPLMEANDEPVDEALFRQWVEQSFNQSSRDHFSKIRLHSELASELDLHHLTASSLTAEILGLSAAPADIQSFAATTLLNLDLPVLSNADAEWVMNVRRDDGEAFQAFRREWEKAVRDLRLEADPSKRAIKLENVLHELTEVQVGAVNQKVQQLRKGLMADAAITVAGLAASIPSGGWSLAASFGAAAKGYKSVRDYYDKVGLSSGFFLWKATKKSALSSPIARGLRR